MSNRFANKTKSASSKCLRNVSFTSIKYIFSSAGLGGNFHKTGSSEKNIFTFLVEVQFYLSDFP